MSGPSLSIAAAHDHMHVHIGSASVDRDRPVFRAATESLVKLQPGTENQAMAAAKKDGADNVFFKMGKDTFVASGRGMERFGRASKGDAVQLVGEQGVYGERGTVIGADYQRNTFLEGAKLTGSIALGAVGATGITGLVLAAKGSPKFISVMARQSPKIAIGLGLVTVGVGIYTAFRSANFGAVETFTKR